MESPRGTVKKLRVLVAADKGLVATRLTAQLEALGHLVVGVARESVAAAESAWQSLPDLIFLDQHLPPHDGIEAAREILARRIFPLVLLIGYPAAGLVRQAQEAGVVAYLVWPVETRMLESTIEAASARFRELQILHEQTGDLPQALRARQVVGRAKVILMRRLGITEADAFGYMQRQSRRTGTPLGTVAEDLIMADELWFGTSNLARDIDVILRVLAQPRVFEPPQVA
jgi:AmiR/NasT family two-component response regulator